MVRLCVREVSLALVSFTHLIIIIGMNVCDSAYENGCVVDGVCATKKVLLLKRHTECLNRTDLCEKEMMRDTFRHANGSHGSVD